MKELALSLPSEAWKTVTWRQGRDTNSGPGLPPLRVRPAHRDYWQAEPHPEEWLLIEWPKGEAEPTKYWLSTLPADTKLKDLVAIAKQRWIIERDYQELKQELGLGHYEGRGWRGFHHHATFALRLMGSLWQSGPFFPLSPCRPILDYQPPTAAGVPAPGLASDPSGIIRTQSPRFASASPAHSFTNSRMVRKLICK